MVVVGDGLAGPVGKHAALGHHRQVKAFNDAGIHLHLAAGRALWVGVGRQVAHVHHRLAEAAAQALRLAALGGLPGLLQAGHQGAVAQHRAQHGHRFVAGAQPHRSAAPSRAQCGRRLRHQHLGDRLRLCGRPGPQLLQRQHAAQGQGQGARVTRHILVGRPGVEQGDLGPRQQARGLQGQRQAGRAGTDHRQAPAGRGCGRRCSGVHQQPSRPMTSGRLPLRNVTMRPWSLLSITSAKRLSGEVTVSTLPWLK